MKVRCVQSGNNLVNGVVYEAEEHGQWRYIINGSSWPKERFELVTGKVVRCIVINDNVRNAGLILDQMYEALYNAKAEAFGQYSLWGFGFWSKEYFVAVEDECPITQQSTPIVIKRDEEDRLRAVLTKPASGNCACGLLRSQCEYHR